MKPLFDLIRFRRLRALPTATADHEGQLRYVRTSSTAGKLHLARYSGSVYEWRDVTNDSRPFTLGPFYINDLPGTATTQAQLGFFNTAVAWNQSTNEPRMPTAGRVVGAILVTDTARTAGTATLQVRVNGTPTAFASGGVVIDGTTTTSNSAFVAYENGVAFTAGQTVGAALVTSGWTPTTADATCWLLVELTPF